MNYEMEVVTAAPDWRDHADTALSPMYPSFLAWNDPNRTGRLVSGGYRRFCEERGLAHLDELDAEDLLHLAAILGGERVQNVLSAPRIAWRLLQNVFLAEDDIPEIAEAFIAEAALKGMPIPIVDPVFSARCDFLVDPGGHPTRISRPAGVTPISVEVIETPNRPPNKGNAVDSELHTLVECNTALGRIDESLRILRRHVPEAYLFICDVMSVLMLRGRRGSDMFESGTFSGYAGLALFTNSHLADVDQLMEGLVHEAVHCMLYMHESVEGGFLLDRGLEDELVTSPWTGARIRLQSFVHACFVWYSVFSLWQTFAAAGWHVLRSSERAAFARRGFLTRPVTGVLEEYSSVLRPGILAALREVESRVTESMT